MHFYRHFLAPEKLWKRDGKPNIEELEKHLTREGRLSKEDAYKIFRMVKQILRREPNLLKLKDPITGTRTFFCIYDISLVFSCLFAFLFFTRTSVCRTSFCIYDISFFPLFLGPVLTCTERLLYNSFFSLWWYSRAVLRFVATFGSWWESEGYSISLFGRLWYISFRFFNILYNILFSSLT